MANSFLFNAHLRPLASLLALVLAVQPIFAQPAAEDNGYIYGDTPQTETLFPEASDLEPVPLLLQGALKKTQEYPVTLDAVLALVDEQNLYIAQTRMDRRIRGNRFYRSLSNFLPDIEGSYGHSRFQGGIQVFGSDIVPVYRTQITPQLIATHRVYLGGRRIFEALAARRRSTSGEELLRGSRQEQLSRAAEEFYLLIEGRIQVENLTRTVQEAHAQVALNEARLAAGVGTKLDLMQARTFLARQERILIDAENTYAQAEQTLLNRLNLDPTIKLLPMGPMAEAPTMSTLVPEPLASDQLVAWALKNHPDIRSTELEAKALKSDFIALATDIIPAVDLQTYISWPGSTHENLTLTRFGSWTARTNIGYSGLLGWPLDLRQSYLLYKQRQYQLEATRRNVENDVTSAFLRSQAFKKAIDAARIELASAEEAARLARGRYQVGLGIFLDVLTAESALSQARINLANAVLGYNRAQVQLVEALGAATPQTILAGFDPLTATGKTSNNAPAQP